MSKKSNAKLDEHVVEYRMWRSQGLSHAQALEHLDYLHPVTLSRLVRLLESLEHALAG